MLRRNPNYSLELVLRRDAYIDTPSPEQRRWLVDQCLKECVQQLDHNDEIAHRFVSGSVRHGIDGEWRGSEANYTGSDLLIEGQQVMQDWEAPLMRRMAQRVAGCGGDILEVGYGLALSAEAIQACSPRSHTIIEYNHEVYRKALRWRADRPDSDIEIVHGPWQQRMPELGDFDGIFWDAFPTSEAEFEQYVLRDSAVAEAFFAAAAAHLRPGGCFTYYTNELDSLSRHHQRALLRYFDSFSVEVVDGLQPPPDCEYWWMDRMALVVARRSEEGADGGR
ncbi:O-methyltransferase [Streptacidiphilus fuscans]|uniref:Class I SAM-dependent methyltransferase n=1 Tax=Streptacidiphilus fuscans TaxID=2789292 RepID=A0A931FF15_9ACTN|nr:class I SAM-dependent methyltransferase [Streptacidiphilus fuscans]MBF9069815.1 class I SAM-dependent methyltransferase [Streptacidiphilus fuscans]